MKITCSSQYNVYKADKCTLPTCISFSTIYISIIPVV